MRQNPFGSLTGIFGLISFPIVFLRFLVDQEKKVTKAKLKNKETINLIDLNMNSNENSIKFNERFLKSL